MPTPRTKTTERRRPNRQGDETEPSAPHMIGFRLDAEHWRCLSEQAASLHTSVGELARFYVIQWLRLPGAVDRLGQGVTDVWYDLNELRLDLALSVQTLLMAAGKVNPAEAQDWVDKNLKTKCSQSPNPGGAPAAPTTT